MNFKRIFFVFGLILLFAFNSAKAKTSIIEKGVLDFHKINFEEFQEIEFTGEWEFYWEKLLEPKHFTNKELIPNPIHVQVPSFWSTISIDSVSLPVTGFATYRLQVINYTANKPLALKLGSIGTANKVYVDGKLISKAGIVAKTKSEAKPGYTAGIFEFTPNSTNFDIIIQASNYHYSRSGLWNNINRLGTASTIKFNWDRKMDMTLFLLGWFFIIGLYHMGLFLLNKGFKSALYFSLFCLVLIARTMVMSELYLLRLIPNFSWFVLVKIEYLTLVLGTIVFSLFVYNVFQEFYSRVILKALIYIPLIFAIFITFSPAIVYTKYLQFYQLSIIVTVFYSFYVAYKSFNNYGKETIIFILGFFVLAFAIINDILYATKFVNTVYIAPYGFMFFVLTQAFLLSYKYSAIFKYNVVLTKELEAYNVNLEKTVEQRTKEINIQNRALTEQKEEIKTQRDNLEKQNTIVTKQKQHITSSIEYARRIQDALLNLKPELEQVAPDSFVLFQPKDIVSGDFYWFKNLNLKGKNYKILTAVDCTGHGVPGAFMSMLGTSYLNEIVADLKNEVSASQILNDLRKMVKKNLNQNQESGSVRDGMDMALCIIDYEDRIIQFAGAYNPIYLVRKNANTYAKEIEVHKGDKMPIGIHYREKDYFTNNLINFNKEDLLYVFTDGYIDQFGGKDSKVQKFKTNRFKNLLLEIAHEPMERQKEILEYRLKDWMGSRTSQIDDITVIGVKL